MRRSRQRRRRRDQGPQGGEVCRPARHRHNRDQGEPPLAQVDGRLHHGVRRRAHLARVPIADAQRRLLARFDSVEDLVRAPVRGGSIDVPVDELHMASCSSEPKSENTSKHDGESRTSHVTSILPRPAAGRDNASLSRENPAPTTPRSRKPPCSLLNKLPPRKQLTRNSASTFPSIRSK